MEAPKIILIQERVDNSWPDGDWINPYKYDNPKELGYCTEYTLTSLVEERISRLAQACNRQHIHLENKIAELEADLEAAVEALYEREQKDV
jgi:hypothetical protein